VVTFVYSRESGEEPGHEPTRSAEGTVQKTNKLTYIGGGSAANGKRETSGQGKKKRKDPHTTKKTFTTAAKHYHWWDIQKYRGRDRDLGEGG